MKSTTSKLRLIRAFPMRAMFALLTAVFVLAIGARADNVYNYNYTGAVQTFTVPAGVTSISVDAYGASSSTISENYEVNNLNGIGLGGRVQGNLSVTPGQTLHLYVGGSSHYAGQSGWPTAYTGWNGGAGGYRRGGGGATDIRIGGTTLDDRVIVSGGGGSGVWYAPGGAGGGLVGGDGSYESGGPGAAKRGQGGTQTAGGLGGGWYDDSPTELQGSFGYGHIGKTVSGSGGNGHGGGGWYGGGGGADDGAGGGGSSYTDPTLSSSVVHTQGVQTGSGKLTITITAPVVTVISGTDTVEQGSTWTDAGATADGGETVTISGTVDTNTPGTYTVTYSATDGINAGTATRTVTVVDTTAPVITVTSGTDTVEQGSTWTDAGATADGNEAVTASGVVDINTLGTYTITYTATDAEGNVGTVTRTVTVEAPTGSETTLLSDGTTVQWANTNGDSVSGVLYDLAQPIKMVAPSGYTVVLRNVGENEEYDTGQAVVEDVHAVLAATGNMDGKGYGGILYQSDGGTDWDHWTTTYVAYAKAPTGSETTLLSDGTTVQWANTNGDSVSGVLYDLAQPIKMVAPSGYTVVLRNVGENEEYDTGQAVVEDVHAVLAATGNMDGKGYGGILYQSDGGTDWDHWTTTYVAYAKAPTGSETTLLSDGTTVQWANTNGDSVSGVLYDLAQPIKMVAPSGYTVVLRNVGENEEYDTGQAVVEDVHAVLAATGNMDGKGYGGILYQSDGGTDWDHWTTTYVAYAKAPTGSETTLLSDGTTVQWANTNGDSVSGVLYDLAQPIKMVAPSGYTVVLRNVGENEEYDTGQAVVEDVHAVLAATGNMDGKGYGGILYQSDGGTDWDHWTTTYVAYAKAPTVKNAHEIQIDANTNIALDSTVGGVGGVWPWYSNGVASDPSNSLSVFLEGVRDADTHRMNHNATNPGSLGQTSGTGTSSYDYTGIPGSGNDNSAKGVVLKYTATEERELLIETTGGDYNDSVVVIFTEAHLNGSSAPFRVVTMDSGDETTFKVKFPYSASNSDENIYYIAFTSYNSSDLGAGAPLKITAATVPDTTAPVITLTGDATISLLVGETYTEAGATAVDTVDGDITSSVVISGTVTTSAVGVYSVNYNVSDTAGNDAVQVTRTVNVEAPTVKNAHEIQIDANTNIALDSTVGGVGGVWPWYSNGIASDPSNSLSVFLEGVRDADTHRMNHNATNPGSLGQTSGTGTSSYDYTGIPGSGNDNSAKGVVLKYTATEERELLIETTGGDYNDSVVVIFTEAHLNGSSAPFRVVTMDSGDETTFKVKFPYSASNSDENIYYIAFTSYNSSDLGAGAPLKITAATVPDTTAPVITLTGDATISLLVGETYTEAGATAVDTVDGDITSSVVISGTVTTSAVGVYSVNYNVSDTAGNDAVQVTRTVNVEAPTVKNAHEIQIDANTNIALDSTVGGVGGVWPWYSNGIASDPSNSLSVFLEGVRDADTHRMNHNATNPGSLGQTSGTGTSSYDYTGIPGSGNDNSAKGVVLKYTATEERELLIETTGGDYNDSVVVIFTEAHLNGSSAPFRVVTMDSGDETTFKVKFPYSASNSDENIYYIAFTSYNSSDLGAGAPLKITAATVPDTTAPVITLTGDATISLLVGETYTEAGATAVDTVDGDITSSVVISGAVSTSAVGVYSVNYNVSDTAGNDAVQVTRTVNVDDGVATIFSWNDGTNTSSYDTQLSWSSRVDTNKTKQDLIGLHIGTGVTSISASAFKFSANLANSQLSTLVVPPNITSIPTFAFYYWEQLHAIILPPTTTSIATEAFSQSRRLKYLIIPDGISLAGWSFAYSQSSHSGDEQLYVYNTSEGKFYEGDINEIIHKGAPTYSISSTAVTIGDIVSDTASIISIEDLNKAGYVDSDGDGVDDNVDAFPLDNSKYVDTTAPTITSVTTGVDLAENSGSGQTVYTITASDDVGVVSYAIGGTDASFLSVGSASGVVSLDANPDYETKPSYSFTVIASDAAGNTSAPTTVTFSITNVDEVAPTVTSSATGTSLAENSGAGQTVYTIAATANDGGTISSYAIGGTNAGLLSVNASTGVVSLTADPDYETKNSYSFTVTASDAAGTSAATAVTFSITNVDEVAPTITSGATGTTLVENSGVGKTVYTITATANDGGTISSYAIGGTNAGLLSVNASTGVVSLTADPDYETKNSYSFTVTASDAGGTSNAKTVSFSITDVDDTAPVISLLSSEQSGEITAWGSSERGGSGAPTDSGYTQILSTGYAFAGLKADGSITAWGNNIAGGSGAPSDSGYTKVFSTSKAFAGLKADGSITAWGSSGDGGSGAPSDSGYTKVFSNNYAFAGLKADGSITAWGSTGDGGSGAPSDSGYTKVFSTFSAFAGLKADGSITAWGNNSAGGSGGPGDSGYTQVFSNEGAFAGLKADGSITAWGANDYGGSGAPTDSGYTQVFSNEGAFAGLKADGSITAWGMSGYGGNLAPSDSGYTQVFSAGKAFAALKADGSITSWGASGYGGADVWGASQAPSDSGYTQVFSTDNAFAALKADGSIKAWGEAGGSGAPTDSGYTQVFSAQYAFAALKADGSINVWGYGGHGGGAAPTDSGYTKVFSTISAFAGLKYSPQNIEFGTAYTELGATASDTLDGDLTDSVTIVSTVNVNSIGTYTVTYTATDAAGNVGTAIRTVTIEDTTAPTISSVTSSTADGSYKVGDTVEVTVNFSEAVTLSGGNLVVTLDTNQTVTISSISAATSASGTYTVQSGDTSSDLTCSGIALSGGSLSDGAGNGMSSFSIGTHLAASSALVIDTTAPGVPTVAVTSSTTDSTPDFSGTAEVGSTVTILVGGTTELGQATADASGNYTFTPSTPMTVATHAVTVKATDAAGNVSSVSSDTSLVIYASDITQYPSIPMIIFAKLQHQDYTAVAGDILRAYVGNELRAKAIVQIEGGVPVVALMVSVDGGGETLSNVFVESAAGAHHHFVVAGDSGQPLDQTQLVSGTMIGNSSRYILDSALQTQTLAFKHGWNFVSMNVSKVDASTMMTPAAYFGANDSKLAEIRTLTSQYNPTLASYLNTLTKIELGPGYWVKTSSAFNHTVEGYLGKNLTVNLEAGWNMAGYPRRDRRTVSAAIGALLPGDGSDKLVQMMSDTDFFLADAALTQFSTMTHFDPGKGYWIKVNANAAWDLSFDEESSSSSGALLGGRGLAKAEGGLKFEQLKRQLVTYPSVPAIVLARLVSEIDVPGGSLVGAFADDELRGVQVVKRLAGKSTVALVVHAEQSETISFKLWNATAQGWQGIQESMKVDSGEVYGSANEMVRLTLDAQPLAKGLGLSRDSMSLVVAPELLGTYKVQRSTDLIHWEEFPISGENAETGLTIDPDQSHEFYRLIRR